MKIFKRSFIYYLQALIGVCLLFSSAANANERLLENSIDLVNKSVESFDAAMYAHVKKDKRLAKAKISKGVSKLKAVKSRFKHVKGHKNKELAHRIGQLLDIAKDRNQTTPYKISRGYFAAIQATIGIKQLSVSKKKLTLNLLKLTLKANEKNYFGQVKYVFIQLKNSLGGGFGNPLSLIHI